MKKRQTKKGRMIILWDGKRFREKTKKCSKELFCFHCGTECKFNPNLY